MGLFTGFKAECINRFPSAWNAVATGEGDQSGCLHVFDGMCLLHAFRPDGDSPESGLDQLTSFFVSNFQNAIARHSPGEIALAFDVTSEIPYAKSEELAKRSEKAVLEIEDDGDLDRGELPAPWEACIADR